MKKIITLIVSCLLLSGCSFIRETTQQIKGELIGQSFTVNSFDNNGNLISQLKGDSITMETYSEQSFLDSLENEEVESSVIQITIDKHEVLSVGNTIIFEEKGIQQVTDFGVNDTLVNDSSNGLNIMAWDKIANKWKNMVGKSRMIIIASQLGVPIAIYEGDNVRVTIPSNLPKTTRITIDGKSLYVHRANYQIIDVDLIK
ncbi:MAG: DUF5052 family protein [Traorella sp.]